MEVTVKSDIGLKRSVNEDRVAFIERPDAYRLAILADGMGGHNAGDVASEMAITQLQQLFLQANSEQLDNLLAEQWLANAIKKINESIYHYSLTHENCTGMGTTIIALLLNDTNATIAHVGDSRVYHFTNQISQLITKDHSFVNVLLENGQISEEEALNHPKKNYILKALGTEKRVEPDFYHLELTSGSVLLVCSDGLSNKVNAEEMQHIIMLPLSINEKGEKLIEEANARGGEDNISIILLSLTDREVAF